MVCLGAQAWDGSEGKVYLQNVGSGLWWGAGQSWGTQASLLQHPEYVTLIADGTNFKMESQVSNGGTSYYFNGSFMDNGDPVSLTITASGDYWTIANGSTYYGYDGSAIGNVAGCVLGSGVDANTDNGKWRIFTEAEMLASLANATTENPMDATFLLLNPSYGRNNRNASAWTKTGSNNTLSGGDNTNCVSESWRSAFETKQTATVPNGYYRLTAQTFLREYTATGTDLPYIYINDAKKDFNLMVTTTASLADVSNYFTNETDGGYYTTTDIVTVTGKSITVGAKGTRDNTWAVWDNFVLQYLGPIDLSEYVTGLANTVSAAEATEGTIPTAAYNAISAVVTENNKTYDNEEDYTSAILAINTAVNTYASEAIVAAYSDYKTLKASVKALNNSIDVTDADALAEAATTADLSSAKAALRSAAVNYLATTEDTNVDITDVFVTNPGFELGNITGWTNSGTQAAGAQGNKVFDNTQGNFYAERWHQNGTVDLNQTVTGLPSGVYEVGAYLYTDTNTGILYANDTQTSFKTSGWYTVRVAIDADGSIKFGASCTLTSSTWICMDGFKLSLVSAGLPDVVAATGKMNAEVATAQTTAIETYNANKTIANYNAAVAAINDAQASVDAYTAANTAITKANTIKEAHNFASTTAAETFAAAIAEIQNNYDENALTTDAANAAGTTLGTVVTAWHGNNNAAAVVYLRDGFALGDFLDDPALHVNTWSTEGDNDGSGFSVPFYESWTSNANSLPKSSISGTITDLPNGLYNVSAWVRVNAKNEVTATDATGITMDVNGGEATDVTEGEQVGTSQFTIGLFEAQGLVKDGKLTLTFNIAEDANISWLSFKNITYTKVRDLTEDEAAIAPTAIALFNGEEEVTEAITLDEENTTVTLNPSYTPANASEGYITWESSDPTVATVANGVVTAITSGTATITVTSTLNTEVSATATINVSFPESTVPTYVNSGATRTVYNFGPNLIKNGSFEYPNPVYGWTTADGNANTNRPDMVASNFNIVETGAADGNVFLQGKSNNGQNSPNSIYTAWPIENGKKYVFGYKIKADKAGNENGYIVTSLSETVAEGTKLTPNPSYGTDWTAIQYEFTNSENMSYLVFSARWLEDKKSFDNFYLCEVLSDPTTIGNVDYAAAAIPTTNVGEGAFQYAPATIVATGINDLVQGTSTPEQVQNVYDALQTMELNKPIEGQRFNIVMGELTWTNNNNATMLATQGKAVTFYKGGRNDAGLYSAQFDKEPNANYAQAFIFTPADGLNKYTISQIDVDGEQRYICTGEVYSGNANQVRTTTTAEDAEVYTIKPSAKGVYTITNSSSINLGAQDAGLYGTTRNNNLLLVEAEKANVEGSLAAGKLATRIFPFTPKAIDGIKYYAINETHQYGNETHITPVEVNELAANTPYIVYNETEEAINITQSGWGTATKDVYSAGALTGVYTDSEIAADAGNYILQTQKDVQAFYLVSGSARTATPYRAYLTAPGAGARIAISFDNETTGINGVNAAEKKFDGTVYDLSGRKVAQPARGLYIVNGKKVVIK